jgi:hypothetical protein
MDRGCLYTARGQAQMPSKVCMFSCSSEKFDNHPQMGANSVDSLSNWRCVSLRSRSRQPTVDKRSETDFDKRDMAIVRRLELLTLEKDTPHTEVDCTYSIIHDESGNGYLQIDTYGSKTRQIPGKKSQSIRFTPEAINQLRAFLSKHF